MALQLRAMTAGELLAMPEDGVRRELVAGELREMSPAGEEHAYVSQNINRSLDAYVFANRLGRVYPEYGYVLESGPDTVRAPDISFVSNARLAARVPGPGFRRGIPDLAIEVVSPSDRAQEVAEKVREYLAAGTPMVVVVAPGEALLVVHRPGRDPLRLGKNDVLDGEDVVPGWKLPVRDIFA